jgi:hypothetical protein
MSLHQVFNDYVVTFDHHEDVQVLDSENAPTKIEGYQVKTKASGNWTIKAITKREPGEGDNHPLLPSILGKLYTLKLQFPGEAKTLQFVSNMPLSVKLKIDDKVQTKDHLLFEELASGVQIVLAEHLKTELSLADAPPLIGLLQFTVTDIPLKSHDVYVRGKLADFLEKIYPARAFRIVPIYRALLSEVAVRNNNQEAIDTYDELVRLKSISRSQFAGLLVAAGVTRMELTWDTIENRLNSEQAPLTMVQGVRREWEGVELDRISGPDVVHLRLWGIIARCCAGHRATAALTDAVEAVYLQVALEIDPSWPFSEMYLKAAIILSLYEPQ